MTPCQAALFALLSALPNRERAYDERIATAIAANVQSPREAAVVFAIGVFESNFAPRIQRGECRIFPKTHEAECDYNWRTKVFQASGFWQIHEASRAPEWPELLGLEPETLDLNARVATRLVRRGLKVCRTPSGAAGYYAGRGCAWVGARPRGALAERVEGKLRECR